MALFFAFIGAVLIFLLGFSSDSFVTKKQLEIAAEKVEKDGVFINNVSYRNAKTQMDISAKNALQTKDKLILNNVSIDMQGRGKIMAEKATIMNDTGIVKASGSVVYKQKGSVEIKGNTATYDASKDVLNVKDNVVVEIE